MPVILDIWNHVAPKFGGIGPSAAALAHAVEQSATQRSQPWRSELLAICDRDESERHLDIPRSVQIVVREGRRPVSDLRLASPLKTALAASNVCHVHGIWEAHSLAVGRLAGQLGKPLVSSVHGMLERWELANKGLKKQIYSFLLERPSLSRSSCLRALSEQEAVEYRRFGLNNPVAVVPNGIAPLTRIETSGIFSRFPQAEGKRIALFMARLHPKKGIFNLIRSWPAVVRGIPDAHLLIAGSSFGDTGQKASRMVSELGLDRSVTFCGVLNGDLKIQAMSAARVFCLPSYSEGMSMSVLEALSIGLPVVITSACNVDGVAECGAGLVTSNKPNELADTLSSVLSLGSSQWQSASDSAQLLARSKYDWPEIGAAMQSVYEWLLGGTQPACVLSN
jgi:poly(glycerol-phosphate) alpha-glucosyltransferase